MSDRFTDFKGIIPAVLTVFDENEELDEAATRQYIRYLLSFPIGGLYLTGSTGAAFLQSSDERKREVEIVMEEVGGKVPVVVHVGDISTKATIDLAKHAKNAGATGVSSVPPFYYPFSEEQIYSYYRDISEATDLPMIIYNVALAGMMSIQVVRRLAELPNVRGIKYTGTAVYQIMRMQDSCKSGFQIYGGCDEQGASNIAAGADGVIGSFYNCIPDLSLRIWEAVRQNDIVAATALQRKALRVIDLGTGSGSTMACLKLWLRAAGVSAGYARRPFSNFTPEEREKLVASLTELDDQYDMGLDIVKRIRARRG